MARKRMIDPNLWQSEDVAHLTIMGRYLFIGMISNADDEGKGRANANYLKSTIFPYDDNMRVAEVTKALSEISLHTSVQIYQVEGKRYYRFLNWQKWQKVEKASPSMIPDPIPDQENTDEISDLEVFPEHSPNSPRTFPERSPNPTRTFPDDSRLIEEKRKEENIIKEKVQKEKFEPDGSSSATKRFVKPTVGEVSAFCQAQQLCKVNPQDFWDYYESNGWKVGKQTMKDWHAAVRRWDRNEFSSVGTVRKPGGFLDYPQREYSKEEVDALFEEVDRF